MKEFVKILDFEPRKEAYIQMEEIGNVHQVKGLLVFFSSFCLLNNCKVQIDISQPKRRSLITQRWKKKSDEKFKFVLLGWIQYFETETIFMDFLQAIFELTF